MICPKCGCEYWIYDRDIVMVIRKFGDYFPKGRKRYKCLVCKHEWD